MNHPLVPGVGDSGEVFLDHPLPLAKIPVEDPVKGGSVPSGQCGLRLGHQISDLFVKAFGPILDSGDGLPLHPLGQPGKVAPTVGAGDSSNGAEIAGVCTA